MLRDTVRQMDPWLPNSCWRTRRALIIFHRGAFFLHTVRPWAKGWVPWGAPRAGGCCGLIIALHNSYTLSATAGADRKQTRNESKAKGITMNNQRLLLPFRVHELLLCSSPSPLRFPVSLSLICSHAAQIRWCRPTIISSLVSPPAPRSRSSR